MGILNRHDLVLRVLVERECCAGIDDTVLIFLAGVDQTTGLVPVFVVKEQTRKVCSSRIILSCQLNGPTVAWQRERLVVYQGMPSSNFTSVKTTVQDWCPVRYDDARLRHGSNAQRHGR